MRKAESSSAPSATPVVTTHLKPHSWLWDWVSHYWQLEGHCPASEPCSFQRLVPGLNAAFIVQLGTPVDVLEEGQWQSRPTAFAEGHFHRPFHLRFADHFRLVGISFAPGRIHSFLRDSQAQINDRFVDLADVLGTPARSLADRLHPLTEFSDVARVFDEFLLSQRPADNSRDGGLHRAMQLAVRQPFATTVREMATVACLSPRQLERRFRDLSGLTPKYFCRVARFDRFVREWTVRPDLLLSTLAQECGYFDQAHLNREFKRFTAESPTVYLSREHAVEAALSRLHAEVLGLSPGEATRSRNGSRSNGARAD